MTGERCDAAAACASYVDRSDEGRRLILAHAMIGRARHHIDRHGQSMSDTCRFEHDKLARGQRLANVHLIDFDGVADHPLGQPDADGRVAIKQP